MITLYISKSYFMGAETLFNIFLFLSTAYFILMLLSRDNRNKENFKKIFLNYFFMEFTADFIWAVYFYKAPEGYINHGLAGIYVFMLWPAMLILSLLRHYVLKDIVNL